MPAELPGKPCYLLSCVQLFATHELPGSSVHGISQTGILEWVAIPFFRGSSQPRDQTGVSGNSCISGNSCLVEWVLHYSCHLESQSDLARPGVGGGVSRLQDTRTTSEQDAFFQTEIQSCYQRSTNSCFPYMNINSICGVFQRQQQILNAQQAGLGGRERGPRGRGDIYT